MRGFEDELIVLYSQLIIDNSQLNIKAADKSTPPMRKKHAAAPKKSTLLENFNDNFAIIPK